MKAWQLVASFLSICVFPLPVFGDPFDAQIVISPGQTVNVNGSSVSCTGNSNGGNNGAYVATLQGHYGTGLCNDDSPVEVQLTTDASLNKIRCRLLPNAGRRQYFAVAINGICKPNYGIFGDPVDICLSASSDVLGE